MDTIRSPKQLTSKTMKRIVGTLSVIAAISVFTGCFYDKEELVYPQTGTGNCDTANMTFSTTILPLINTRCNDCHTGNVTSGFNFSNYNVLRARAISGELMNRLTTTDPSKHMPQGGPMLPDCEIQKFRAWVARNAPN